MERRVLVAILLSFVVLYAYQALVVKPVPPNGSSSATGVSATGASGPIAATGSSSTTPPPTSPQTPAHAESPNPPPAQTLVSDTAEREVTVETRDVIATFTNRGARLKSWRLKHYLDQRREPQELIAQVPTQPLPFTLRTASDPLNQSINNALYSVTGAPAGQTNSPVDLRFEYRETSGISSVKTFHFEPTAYVLTFRISVTDGSQPLPVTVMWGPGVGDTSVASSYTQAAQGLLEQASKVQRLAIKDIAKQPVYEGDFKYAGVDDNYFMTVALDAGPSKISYQHVSIPGPGPKDPPRELVAYSIEPRQLDAPMKYFVGPKDFDVLAAIGPDMTRAINFGMFSVIVVPLLRSLKWVHTYVGNWGWSIVVLTVIINIILFPLQHKSIVSMRKMQEIQPQMKAIQDRYAKYKATDPEKQKMNQELMALYKERGVNPASGCVPMLLTMPLLLAMWAMLQTSIELRGAPFFGWIHDLTAHDPY